MCCVAPLAAVIFLEGCAVGMAAAPLRPFKLMSDSEAAELLRSGFLDPATIPVGAELVRELADATNSAVVSIRQALLSSGVYREEDVPLLGAARRLPEKGGTTRLARRGIQATPGVWKLALLGGVCGGKTKSRVVIREALSQVDPNIMTFSTREVASVLFSLGAMSGGSYQPLVQEEYSEYAIQSELLQLSFEEIWSRGAADAVSGTGAKAAVLTTDRDAVDGRFYSQPVNPTFRISWSQILDEAQNRLQITGLSTELLVSRYELGAVFWHSLASRHGSLNALPYEERCVKPTRHETPEEALLNDDRAAQLYVEVYRRSDILWMESLHEGNRAEKINELASFLKSQMLQVSSKYTLPAESVTNLQAAYDLGAWSHGQEWLLVTPLLLAALLWVLACASWLSLRQAAAADMSLEESLMRCRDHQERSCITLW